MKNIPRNRGLVKTILLILMGILFLGFIGIDLEKALKDPLVVKNFNFVWNTTKQVWIEHVYTPITNIGKTSDQQTLETPTDPTE